MLNPGDKFDKYTLVRPLGEGGMGIVWEATNPFGLPVVLKMLQPEMRGNADIIERFRREGRIQYTLKHPHIVRVTDIVESDDGLPALVVDFMSGRDLEQRLFSNGPLTIEETIEVSTKVLDGLQLAHEHGFFHRDLKPANIYLEKTEHGFEPRLMDFGIAKIEAAAQLTRAQEFCGTPAYASPEQIASTKDVDHMTDIYSFGVVMWSMFMGHEPYKEFNDDPYRVLAAVVREELTPPDNAPDWLAKIIKKATRKPKEARYQSAAEFRDAIVAGANRSGTYAETVLDIGAAINSEGRALAATDTVFSVSEDPFADTHSDIDIGGGGETAFQDETEPAQSGAVKAKERALASKVERQRQENARRELAEMTGADVDASEDHMRNAFRSGGEFQSASGMDSSGKVSGAKPRPSMPPRRNEPSPQQPKTSDAESSPRLARATAKEKARAKEVERSFSNKRKRSKKPLMIVASVLLIGGVLATVAYIVMNAATTAASGFVRIEAGSFMMGSPLDENGRGRDEAQHNVTITRPFAMQIHEVTQAQWREVMYAEPDAFTDCGDSCPAAKITWVDAARFANRLSVEEGVEQCYEVDGSTVEWPRGLDCAGFRLPTEAEWEYAARGGTDSAVFTGDLMNLGREVLDPRLTLVGWYASNSDVDYNDSVECGSWGEDRDKCGVQPAQGRRVNPWGLYDTHGNLAEWTWDRYGPYPGGDVTDPLGASSGSQRVVRGGSWRSTSENCRAAARDKSQSVARMTIGLRLAQTLR
ncbi:MAG: serine/threonine protein kinase [Bradymonadia bacterium]|jgi:serine/threonine protein kinase